MAKMLDGMEAMLRGEAPPAVQGKNCARALAHGTGGQLGSRHGAATRILERG